MSRTKNSIKIVVSSFICQVVIAICGFILPPLIIHQYGSEINGLLSLVKQLMVYFSVVCLGIGAAAQVALYKPLAESNWKAVSGIFRQLKIFYAKSGIYFSILVLLASGILPFLIKSNISYIEIFLIVVITGVGSICEYVIIAKYRILLVANQQQYINSRITAEGIVLNTIVSVLLIKFDFSVIILQLGATVVYIIRLLMTIRYVQKHYPNLSSKKTEVSPIEIKDRWTALVYQLPRMIITLSPMIIISIECNLDDASVFSVYLMVFNALTMISAIFSSGMQAPFGNIIANNEQDILKNAFRSFEFIYSFMLTFCFVCSALLMLSFINSYLHNTDGVNYSRPALSLLMALNFLLYNFRIPFTTLIEARGLFKNNVRDNILEAVLFLAFAILLTYYWGIVGIPIAGIITSGPRTILYMVFTKKHFVDIVKFNTISFKMIGIIIVTIILVHTITFPQYPNVFKWLLHIIPIAILVFLALGFVNYIIDPKVANMVVRKLGVLEKIRNCYHRL